jgi:tetratricopeptide (TPR) repeat protein
MPASPSYGPHRTIEEVVNVEMKRVVLIAVLVACVLAGRDSSLAQSSSPPSSSAQNKPSAPPKAAQNQPKPGSDSNPFPEDTTNVPVMPNSDTPAASDVPSNNAGESTLPRADVDPVRSPDEPQPDSATDAQGFSSSTSGMDRVLPPPDTDARSGKSGKSQPAPEHQETAAEDESVGSYYLDQKNWKAALSRFESAVVLDPENPEVYWGLAEAQRHIGKFTEAKASYQKLLDYDPDSKHGKEARKILKSPELANAPTASASKP